MLQYNSAVTQKARGKDGEVEGVLPYMAFIDVWPKKVGISAVLVINRVWFLYSSLELLVFLLLFTL